MIEVYVLHRNVPYEFGTVVGVFLTMIAAIDHVPKKNDGGDYSVTRWIPADDPAAQSEQEVWVMRRGQVIVSPPSPT